MTLHQVNTKWDNGLAFDSQIGDHTVRMDASGEMGNNSGVSPKKMLLASLSGCTGMDVVSLLNKMRVPFTRLEIDAEGDLRDEHPKVYTEIRLVYRLYGENLDNAKVEKAIDLSQEKYCGVSAMLKKSCPVKYTIEYA